MGRAGYEAFMEAEGELAVLNDTGVGWYTYTGPHTFTLTGFDGLYKGAHDVEYDPILPANSAVRREARALLQRMYQDLPFPEMKMEEYGVFFVRPPQ